jgi:hypothetical protein
LANLDKLAAMMGDVRSESFFATPNLVMALNFNNSQSARPMFARRRRRADQKAEQQVKKVCAACLCARECVCFSLRCGEGQQHAAVIESPGVYL